MAVTNFGSVTLEDDLIVGDDATILGDLAVTGTLTATGAISAPLAGALGSADGAITLKNGVVFITKAGVAALTLADPTDVTDDFKVLHFISKTANAHTVTIAGGLNGVGAGADVGTFGAAAGNRFSVIAHGGKWWSFGVAVNVTFA